MRRLGFLSLVALFGSAPAFAQPAAPAPPAPPPQQPAPDAQQAPAPQPQPAPASGDSVLDEQIAEQLVGRAQELLDAKLWLDAKQLAVEALVKSPKGTSAERAKYIIKLVNQHLDIKEDPPPTPPSEVAPTDPYATPKPVQAGASDGVDLTPIDGSQTPPPPVEHPTPALSAEDEDTVKDTAMVHGILYGGTIGATIGALASPDHPAKAAVPLGLGLGVAGGLAVRPLVEKLKWDEAQTRTAGSFSTWGGIAGGLFAEAVTGAGDSSPSSGGVLLGASIGATLGLGAGAGLAHNHKFTAGDVALIDTLTGIGAVGGVTLGMLMQPAQPEAYSVNSILGIAGGIVVGLVAAPQTNTTPRRMLRVAGLSAAGGALPFLLYAGIYDSSSRADERVTGVLSTAGLVIGAYLGFRVTSGMDAGLDVDPHKPAPKDDAPIALVGRSSDGHWAMGGVGVMPLSKQLATNNRGMTFTVVGATF